MVYTYRFNVVENVTALSNRIAQSFGFAGRAARGFASDVDGVGRSTDRARDELGRFISTKNRAFSGEGFGGFNSQLGRSMGMLRGMVGLLAALGIGAAVKSVVDYGDNLYTSNALIQGILRNQEQVNQAQATARRLSDLTGTSYAANLDGMAKMLTVTKGNVQEAGNLTRIGAALAAINPAEGFEGALFALKELEGGDTMSLRERFNIRVPTASEAKEIAARDGRTVQEVMYDSLQSYLDTNYGGGQAGQGVEYLLTIRANTIGGQLSRIGNAFANIFTPMLLPFLQQTTLALTRVGDWVQANGPMIEGLFINMLAGAQPMFDAGLAMWSQMFGALAALWPQVQPMIASTARLLASIYPIIARIGGAIWQIVQPAIVVMAKGYTMLYDAIAGFLERNRTVIFGVIDGISLLIRAVLGAVVGVVQAYLWLREQIAGFFEWMGEMAVWAWENNPFTWMVDLVDRVFPGFKSALAGLWDWAKGLFSDLTTYIWDNFIKPVFGWLASLWDSLGQGDKSPALTPPAGAQAGAGGSGQSKPVGAPALGLGVMPGSAAPRQDLGVNKAMDSAVQGDRTAIKNISINIGKQIETLSFNTVQDLKESADIIRREVERALLDAVNQANYAT